MTKRLPRGTSRMAGVSALNSAGPAKGSSVPTSAFDKRTVGRMVPQAGRVVLRVEHPGFLRCALQPLLSMVGGDVSLPLAGKGVE